ncbi:hypothetical protein [Acerihabitans arboris]|uniref:Uncharacterized protein n=1 Tax=Acerihabitans arboris TaxID=2691583 RepID=A0A845SPV1_9GAMM|nr:hypothetical protein [Acerihabitans arboris]NDL65382.1 hypothetical protein [Acerihabitans arboris]
MKNISYSNSTYPVSIPYPQSSIPCPRENQTGLPNPITGQHPGDQRKNTPGRRHAPFVQTTSAGQYDNADNLRIDNLYSCVAELTRQPESLLKNKGSKYIKIFLDGQKKSIFTKIITLSSGREIYVGNISGRMMVSDGEIYHLEYSRPHYPINLSCPLMLIWAQVSLYFCHPQAWHGSPPLTPDITGRSRERPYEKTTPYCAAPSGAAQFFSCWKDRILQPVKALLNVFNLPAASAQDMHEDPDSHEETVDQLWPTDIHDLLAGEINPRVNLHGCRPDIPDAQNETYFTIGKSLSFMIDGEETTLIIPHRDAQLEFERLVSVFSLITFPTNDSLSALLAFDEYVGEKVQDFFDQGTLSLKDRETIYLILLKGKIEAVITEYLLSKNASSATKHAILKYAKGQIFINFFIKIELDKLNMLSRNFEIDNICETVEYKKGVTFGDARNNVLALYRNAAHDQKLKYIEHYKTLLLMEEAKMEYCSELYVYPKATTLEKVIYNNDMKLLEALFEEDNIKVNDIIKKRIFYSIYDFTRKNDISLQSENLLIPGELTKFNAIFDEIDFEIKEEEILNHFSNEIISYCSLKPETAEQLVKVLKVVELFRNAEDDEDNKNHWSENNLNPFLMAKNLYHDLISSNTEEKTRMVWPKEWYEDYKKQLILDKTSYLMTDIMIHFQNNFNRDTKIFLGLNEFDEPEDEEQRITNAKIAAVELSLPFEIKKGDYDSYIKHYRNSISQGYIELLISAAAHWNLSNHRGMGVNATLWDAHFLMIVRSFSEQEHNIATELHAAATEKFSSVYNLKPSGEFDNKQDYFSQFTEYKIHMINKEARFKTFFAVKYSSLGYYDLIYNPKAAYTFKVFSRKYIENTLAHAPSVLTPATNLGFVSIVLTQSERLIMISTLSDFASLIDVSQLRDTMLITRLISEWKEAPDHLEVKSRNKFPVTMDELNLLFLCCGENNLDVNLSLDLLLIKPADNQHSNPSSEFSFAAVKEFDTDQNLRGFIDTLNRKTLIEVCNGLKEPLRTYTWIDYVTMNIPFYHIIERYWYDADMELTFEDVFFDIFDLLIALVPTGFSINKLSRNYISLIIRSAKKQKIPKHLLKRFFITEFSKLTPSMIAAITKTLSSDLLQFMTPLPLSVRTTINLPIYCYNNLKKNMFFVNAKTKLKKTLKQSFRKEWSVDIGVDKLTPMLGGVYIENGWKDKTRHFIKDHNEVFQVRHDEKSQIWRVLDPSKDGDINNAIAVVPQGEDMWALSPVSERMGSSIFSQRNLGRNMRAIIKDLEIEQLAIVQSTATIENNYFAYHTKMLSFFLDENGEYINELLSTNYDKEAILSALTDRLTGTVARDIVFPGEDYSTLQNILIHEFYSIPEKFETHISYRSVNFWLNEEDYDPINHLLIKVKIGDFVYILDVRAIRPLTNINANMYQVYLENNWLLNYKNNLPNIFALVKFKDYNSIKEALSFSQGENVSPSMIITDAYLLREPKWYRSTVLKNKYSFIKKTRPILSLEMSNFRGICRKAIRKMGTTTSPEVIPPKILRKAGVIDKRQADMLLMRLQNSKTSIMAASIFLDAGSLVPDLNTLIKINPGKLVLCYGRDELLQHTLISIGGGRFAGAGNSFFDPRLSDRAAILMAEELGEFSDQKLTPRSNTSPLNVIVGNVKGAADLSPVISPPLARDKVLSIRGDGEPLVQQGVPSTREGMLLGDSWELHAISGMKTHIQIKMHGAPFNVNYMDAAEFSHVVRGLLLANPDKYDLARLQSIDLYSCFSGFGGKYSMAQTLANELQVQVRGYPGFISRDIEQRHPAWFKTYMPIKPKGEDDRNSYTQAQHAAKMESLRIRHGELHDFVAYLMKLRNKARIFRHKRSFASIAKIQTELAQLILGNISLGSFVDTFDIQEESENVLTKILIEYQFDDNISDDIFLQLYFDIIFTVERFREIRKNWSWI